MSEDEQLLKRRSYAIEYGALTQCPVYETHKRGKNWCALVTRNPKSPGGLARQFWEPAKGEWFYIIPATPPPVGSVLEFGADYYSASGRKSAKRAYCVVEQVTETSLNVVRFDEPQAAFAFAKTLGQS